MQQINLYQPMLRKARKVFSARALAQSLAVIVVALVAIGGFGQWQLSSLERELMRARAQQLESAQRVEQLRAMVPVRPADAALQQRVEVLQQEQATKQRVLSALSGSRPGNHQGFVEQLEGLARQSLDGLWLTRVEIAGAGTVLGLHGRAVSPELLPRYLQRLGDEPVFAGTEFRSFVMAQGARESSVEFTLDTRGNIRGAAP